MTESQKTLWLTDDQSRLVPDLDPEARYLFCVAGEQLDGPREARYLASQAQEKPATKHVEAPAETKQVTQKATKGAN